MLVTHFNTAHDDLVHDVAYDYYGKRLVTCSSDQKIKVWDWVDESSSSSSSSSASASHQHPTQQALLQQHMQQQQQQQGKWVLNDTWKAHDSSILKITWAHPEFGQIFASCSFDKTVRIWEEQENEHKNSGRRWVEKARLVDFRGTVQDIEFAPNHLGLKLAACSADGIVRIYEAMDIVNLSNWTLMEEFEVSGMGNTTTTTTSTITSSTSSSAISNAATFQQPNFSLQPSTALKDHSDAHYCLSWCPSRFGPQMLTVGCGPFHSARIFRMDMHNKWVGMETLPHIDVVTDIAWAPNVGRSYQLIATSSKDGHVRIFKLSDESPNKSQQSTYATAVASSLTKKRFKVELIGDFPDHHSEVWRVEWNITGTVLSSSGDDGKVRLWKPTYLGEWKCLAIVAAESSGASSQLMNSHSSSLEQSQNIASNNALKSNQSSILNLAQGANTSGGHSKGSSFTGTSVFGTTASSSTSQQHQQQQQPSTSFTSTTTSTSTQPQQGFMSSSNVSSSLFSPVSTDMSSAALMGSSPGTSHQKYHHGYGYGFSGGD